MVLIMLRYLLEFCLYFIITFTMADSNRILKGLVGAVIIMTISFISKKRKK